VSAVKDFTTLPAQIEQQRVGLLDMVMARRIIKQVSIAQPAELAYLLRRHP
jgi:hypothetical protein